MYVDFNVNNGARWQVTLALDFKAIDCDLEIVRDY